jgi:hypothetical protein
MGQHAKQVYGVGMTAIDLHDQPIELFGDRQTSSLVMAKGIAKQVLNVQ